MDRGYTKAHVEQLERNSSEIARLLANYWGSPVGSYRRWNPEMLDDIIYDAMVALYEQMLAEEKD